MSTSPQSQTVLTALAAVPGYTWRPAHPEDAPQLLALLQAVNQADGREPSTTLQDLQTQMEDPWLGDPQDNSLLAVAADGTLAAMGFVFTPPDVDRPHAFLDGEVHPDHRRRGLGAALLEWMEARGRQRLQALNASQPPSLRVSCQDTLADRLQLFERRGFRPIRYFFRMHRDLAQPIPEAELPAGLSVRTFTPVDSEPLRQAFNESFADHWDFHPAPPEDWQMFVIGRDSFRPDLTLLALDGGQIAGYSVNRVNEEENQTSGRREGWVSMLGVRRPWRKRGLASALLCQSLRAFRAEGLEYAKLSVDAENLTGALRLYERLGFTVTRRFVALEKKT